MQAAVFAAAALQVYSSATGLAPGWSDYGWAPRKLAKGAPAQLDLSGYGGWIVAHDRLQPEFAALTFRLRAPASAGDFFEVRLSSPREELPKVRVRDEHRTAAGEGWLRVSIPLAQLDPQGAVFDKIVFRAAKEVGHDPVELDDVVFTEGGGPGRKPAVFATRPVPVVIRCDGPSRPISPLIYGIAFSPRRDAKSPWQWDLGATARRWGGNPASRYNWQLGNAWNTADDWFFRNVDYTGVPGFSWRNFLDDNRRHGVGSVLTIPMLGWVAKDTQAASFPRALYGEQQQMDGDRGNGLSRDGKPLPAGPPTLTSVPAPPDFEKDWVKAIRERGPSPSIYILDNEPALWSSTHRDVHPEPVTYDELWDRTVRYGEAIRSADPDARIAGFAAWGWPELFYSAADSQAGIRLRPDRRAHGDVPLMQWWLRKVRAHEKSTGHRLVDLVDVHFYPQSHVGQGEEGGTDLATAQKRIRSTRALWDPAYVDESWIGEPVRLIPRMRAFIDENAPGLGLQIGEYNFGAEGHISGGLAVAEALGRFGQLGVTSAFYWTYPGAGTPAFQAFRAFRNFDGKGARFGERSLPARTAADLASAFGSQDAGGRRVVAVLLNHDPARGAAWAVSLQGCAQVQKARAFTYAGAGQFEPVETAGGDVPAAPFSMTVVELTLR